MAVTPGAGGVVQQQQGQVPMVLIARPLPRVLLLHTGGTLGMDASESYEQSLDGHMVLKQASWVLLTSRSAAAGLRLLHALWLSCQPGGDKRLIKCLPVCLPVPCCRAPAASTTSPAKAKP